MGDRLTVAVTGLNATDNPAPGVPVIRALRHAAAGEIHIVGLAYDALDPGAYMEDVADDVFLIPYPSEGADVLLKRIEEIRSRRPIDVVLPTLDSELQSFLKILEPLSEMGIKTFLPRARELKLRSKSKFHELKAQFGINVPKSIAISDASQLLKIDKEFRFPVVVKGQFYGAEVAYSPMEVQGHFQRLRSKWGIPVIVQEFIAGEEYDIASLGNGRGEMIGAVPMRKMQLTDKGKAWGGITVYDPSLLAFVEHVIDQLDWRGPCELEVMRSRNTGQLFLIEINPRFPAWIYLAVGADRNLPWATVELALGKNVPLMPPPEPGVMFLRHSFDQICTLDDFEQLSTQGELSRGSR